MDFSMDRDVVESQTYGYLMDSAFLDIPTISIVTDLSNLFDRSQGIYVNARERGKSWERPCSIELINPDGSEGFYENAGLRIRGGYSRHPQFPKHAFRLFFREEYGTDKLRYPLFESEGVSEFDKVDLRCAQNYAWSNGLGEHNTFVREVFARDTQGAMGQPYTRSRYYHLFLNGMYWGLYQTQERAEARFASSYLGGSKEDYDVVKVNTDFYQYEIEATDGTTESWQEIWGMTQFGLSQNANYFKLEGKNSSGVPIPESKVLVDIDNLIDYMIIVFYTGSFDAPISQFIGNDRPNNFYAIDNRDDKSRGFQFFVHDMEHAMMVEPVTVGSGINENRVNIDKISGDRRMEISEFKYSNPQWLHHKLTQNEEYRIRFADRVAKHFFNNGALTIENCLQRFNERASQIDLAIIAESARWGDTRSAQPLTKENAWIPELNKVRNTFFPRRKDIVLSQLRQEDLFTNLQSPQIFVDDTLFSVSEYFSKSELSLSLVDPNNSGVIYYTLNGDDPRMVGGGVDAAALVGEENDVVSIIGSAIISARIKQENNWSPLRTLQVYSNQQDLSNLKITEIHYHPEDVVMNADTIYGKDIEFIEFKNSGSSTLNLSGISLDSAISYTFPEKTLLASGEFVVLTSDHARFYDIYGRSSTGEYKGNLSNGGEQLIVTDADNNVLFDITYDDKSPWPDKADGNGPSLVPLHESATGNPSESDYWRISIFHGGSPFRDDNVITFEPTAQIAKFSDFSIFPNPASDRLQVSINNIPNDQLMQISLFDLNGKLLLRESISNNGYVNLKSIDAASGLMIASIECRGKVFTGKVVLKP